VEEFSHLPLQLWTDTTQTSKLPRFELKYRSPCLQCLSCFPPFDLPLQPTKSSSFLFVLTNCILAQDVETLLCVAINIVMLTMLVRVLAFYHNYKHLFSFTFSFRLSTFWVFFQLYLFWSNELWFLLISFKVLCLHTSIINGLTFKKHQLSPKVTA
jgi:hypothetical protein